MTKSFVINQENLPILSILNGPTAAGKRREESKVLNASRVQQSNI